MNNAVFRKTMENVRKYRDMKLVTTEARRNYLVTEWNYHRTIFFGKFISHRNEVNINIQREKHDKVLLVIYYKLNILLSRALMKSYISHNQFVSVSNVLENMIIWKKQSKV